MTFNQLRQTTTFKVAAGATAAAAVVGGVATLTAVRRWRADALKRPGTFSSRIAQATPLRAVGRRLKPAVTSVLPYAICFPVGWCLNSWYMQRP